MILMVLTSKIINKWSCQPSNLAESKDTIPLASKANPFLWWLKLDSWSWVAWPLERQDLPLMQGLKKKKRHGHRQCWLSLQLLFVFAGFFPWMKITYVFSNICSQREFFYTILSIRYDIRWFHIQCQSHVILHINHMHVQKWFTIEVRLHM